MRTGGDMVLTRTRLRRRPTIPVLGVLVAVLAATMTLALSTAPRAHDVQTADSVRDTAVGTEVVAFRAKANNRYVTAENTGKSSLIANRTAIGSWETFDLIHVNSTDVYLRAHANGKLVAPKPPALLLLSATAMFLDVGRRSNS